jgi:exonuclease SbcC
VILKSIALENIRSYKQANIEFPQGITLFEGDVGSGKSTILMAIEFALFGTGTQPGGSLLKYNESKGVVTLTFEVDDKEYSIKRTLSRKNDRVLQGQGHIKGPEGRMLLSASELKERVLGILNFNEPPNARAQNVIYRYAIFTPQEEMKTIITLNADDRLQTLRRAFRVEEYKLARDNANFLASSCDKRARYFRAAAEDLEGKKHERADLDTTVAKNRVTLDNKREREKQQKDQLASLAQQYDNLSKEKEELKKAEGEQPQLKKQKDDKQREIKTAEEAIKNAVKQLDDIGGKIQNQLHFKKPTDRDEQTLSEDVATARKERADLEKVIHGVDYKLESYKSICAKDICPTCLRPVDSTEFTGKITLEEKARTDLLTPLNYAQTKVENAEDLLKRLQDYNHVQDTLVLLEKQATDYKHIQEANSENIERLKKDIDEIEQELEKTSGKIESLKQISQQVEELRTKKSDAEREVAQIGKDIASLEATTAQLERNKEALDAEIAAKEAKIDKANVLDQYKMWLDNYFVPTLGNIERHAMISFQQEFNRFFQKWFRMLVDDPTKDARIDESFKPIVEQDGYEQNLDYLSGGEKTSVALAYRLALNMLVRKAATSMKSNLLILDEPTDGFSKEQLLKMQDIFDELACPQVIIVSHERELESFANQVFWISKSDGVSTIQEA